MPFTLLMWYPITNPPSMRSLASEVLGLELHVTAKGLRYYDPETATYLLTHREEFARRRDEAAARQAARTIPC